MKKTGAATFTPYERDARYITGHRDVDPMILDYIDDSDILSLMQISNVNKKIKPILEDPAFFEKRIKTRYPSLIPFKKVKENWREYYLRSMKDIRALKKEFDLDYPHRGTMDLDPPEKYLRQFLKLRKVKPTRGFRSPAEALKEEAILLSVRFAAFEGYEKDLFDKMEEALEEAEKEEDIVQREDRISDILSQAIYTVVSEGNIPLYLKIKEKFKKYNIDDFIGDPGDALYSGDINVIDFLFDEYMASHTEEENGEFIKAIGGRTRGAQTKKLSLNI